MITEVAESIMQHFGKDVTFKKALAGGLYFQQAPQGPSFPYSVFYFIGVTQEEIMGTADDNITEVSLQFNVFSTADDGGQEIAILTDKLTDCFDWQELHPAGYRCIKMQRESIAALGFIDEVWQASINYDLGIQKE